MELEGKVALVTGASGGIGAAVARGLHAAGDTFTMALASSNARWGSSATSAIARR